MPIVAQLFGIGAMASLFLLYQQKSRRRMLAAKLSADVFWVAHYLCLGGIAGAIPNGIGIFRELVFLKRKHARWASLALWPILFILVNWGLGIASFDTPFDVLPIAASTFVTISLWIDNPRLTKLISIPISAAFLVYDMHVDSYVGVLNELIAIGSIILSFIREHKKERK